YVISVEATNCRTGDTIEKTQVQAARKDDVLKALGDATGQLRRHLGESLASIGKYDAPIQDATTASLDALKSYSVGMATRRRQGDAASMPFFRTAIEQDPNFALAHARLSTVYGNLGEQSRSRDEITKAYALRDRVSEPERLYITARYATTVEGSMQKTIETYQIWTQTYPNDFVPHSNLAGAFEQRGDHDKAIEEYRTAIRLAPDEPLPYGNLAGIFASLGRGDEARKTIEEAIGRGLDSIGLRSQLYGLAFFRGDEAEMARQVAAAQRLPEGFRMLQTQAYAALYAGRLARARELCEQFTREAASRIGLNGAAASQWSNFAQGAATLGDVGATRAAVRRALELERNLDTVLGAAFAMVVARDVPEAQRFMAEAARLPGADAPDGQFGLKLVNVLIRLRQGDRTAVDAVPPPKSDSDMTPPFHARHGDPRRRQRRDRRRALQTDHRSRRAGHHMAAAGGAALLRTGAGEAGEDRRQPPRLRSVLHRIQERRFRIADPRRRKSGIRPPEDRVLSAPVPGSGARLQCQAPVPGSSARLQCQAPVPGSGARLQCQAPVPSSGVGLGPASRCCDDIVICSLQDARSLRVASFPPHSRSDFMKRVWLAGLTASILIASSVFIPAADPPDPGVTLIGTGAIPGNALDLSGLQGLPICALDIDKHATANCIDRATLGGFGSALTYTGHDNVFVAVPDRGPFDGRTDV